MLGVDNRFTILLCGKRMMMDRVRRLVPVKPEVNLRFTSSPEFLAGRALFSTPGLVLIEADNDTTTYAASLKEFAGEYPSIPIVALTTGSDANVTDLAKAGISAFFNYPDDNTRICERIVTSYREWEENRKKLQFIALQEEAYDFSQIIGRSAAIRSTIERARTIIRNKTMTVLITGETGTGKELFARAVHYNGRTKTKPFVDIGCSALPETLLESELFGYERGAFTDAKERKIGLFELAGDGTIFLDEIGDISLSTQSKLLKVIEDRSMRRLGGINDIPVRARIIAATSADLETKMKTGEFRKDLYHRLKILPLEIPPLRERIEDIPLLVEDFLKTYNRMYEKRITGITHHAMQILMDHHWEGNIRELRHLVERAVLLEEGNEITEKDFDLLSVNPPATTRNLMVNPGEQQVQDGGNNLLLMIPFKDATIQNIQQILVRKVLEHVGGNKLRASRILKISRPRLDRILKAGDPDIPD